MSNVRYIVLQSLMNLPLSLQIAVNLVTLAGENVKKTRMLLHGITTALFTFYVTAART